MKQARETLPNLGYGGIREGQVQEAKRINSALKGNFLFGNSRHEDTRTEEEKFQDTLDSKLGLTSFPTPRRSEIFKECARESAMGYVRLRTTYNLKLDDWPKDHPIPFFLGLIMGVTGFLGSFGHRTSSIIILGTAGRLLSWVRTGDASPEERPAQLSQVVPSVTPAETTHEFPGSEAAQNDGELVVQVGFGKFLPHILILGGLLAVLGIGLAANDPAIGRFLGRAAASALDPPNLAIAAVLGFAIRRHLILIPSLITLGAGLAVIVAQMNVSLGARLTPETMVAKVAAALAVGYLINLIRVAVGKKGSKRNMPNEPEK